MLDMLRKYWNPIATTDEVTTTPIRRRMLGEELVLFRDEHYVVINKPAGLLILIVLAFYLGC